MFGVLSSAATGSLADLLANAGTVLTSVLGWVGDVVDTIVGTPFLMVFFFLAIGASAVGLLKRLMYR